MELMDLDRYKRIGYVSGVQVNPLFTITDGNIKKILKSGAQFENFSGPNALKGNWVSVEDFKKKFSSYAMERFGDGFKNTSILVVKESKGVQNPETFAQDVISEVVSRHAHYVPVASEKENDKALAGVECVREQDIQSVLRSYYVIAQKDVSAPVIEPVRNGEPGNSETPKPSIRLNAQVVQNPSRDTSGLPLSRAELPKLRAWYFSGKTLSLKDDSEEMSFNKAIEVFHEKWEHEKVDMSFDEWLGKILPEKLTAKRPKKKNEADAEIEASSEVEQKRYYILKSGDYISESEFKQAILKYFKEIEKSFSLKVVKKDEGTINAEELVDKLVQALSNNGKVKVTNRSTKFNSAEQTLSGAFPTEMQLPCGKFINLQDVMGAMQNYLVVEKEKIKPIPPTYIPRKPEKTNDEGIFDKFIKWLNGLVVGEKEEVEPSLIEKFKKAIEKLELQWKDEKKKEPKKARKSFREWVKDWIDEHGFLIPRKKGEEPIGDESPQQEGDGLTGGNPKPPIDDDLTKKKPKVKDGDTNKKDPEDPEKDEDTPGITPKPPIKPVEGGSGESDPTSEIKRVIKITPALDSMKKGLVLGLALLALLPLSAGIGVKNVETPYAYSVSTTEQQNVLDHQDMMYSMNVISQIKSEIPPTLEEIMAYIEGEIDKGGNITLGEYSSVEEGQAYYLQASTKTESKIFGAKDAHSAGQYRVTGLAISDGKNIAYIEDFDAKDMETSLKKLAHEAQAKGLDWSKAQVFWHAGSKSAPTINADGTQGPNRRAGWIVADGYSFKNMPTSTQQVSINKTQVSGTVENFTGTTIMVNAEEFKVVDEGGKPLKPGTYVNDNGTQYEINEVKLDNVYRSENITTTKTETGVNTERKLTYNLGIVSVLGVGLAAGLFAVLEAAKRKINKKLADNPQFMAFGDAVSFEEFRVDFEKTAKEMKQTINEKDVNEAYKAYLLETQGYIDWSMSTIEKAVITKAYNMKSYFVELTESDMQIMEEIAIQTAQSSDQLGFNPETDTLKIQGSHKTKDGAMAGHLKIIVNYNENPSKDGEPREKRSVDITEQVMKKIKHIGEKNPIRGIDPETMKKLNIIEKAGEGSQLGQ